MMMTSPGSPSITVTGVFGGMFVGTQVTLFDFIGAFREQRRCQLDPGDSWSDVRPNVRIRPETSGSSGFLQLDHDRAVIRNLAVEDRAAVLSIAALRLAGTHRFGLRILRREHVVERRTDASV